MSAPRFNVDIVYFYEHVARELDVACAVACHARNRYGLTVEIVQWPNGYRNISGKLLPRVVVLPFCYSSRSYISCLVEWREAIYFNISWEQLFYEGNRVAKTPRGNFARLHVVHHAWSDFYADILKQNGVPEKNVFINGQPAYMLYEEPYRYYFKTRQELASTYKLDNKRKWVFFPENYNWAFYSEATLQRFIDDGQSPEDIFAMRDFCRFSLREVFRWCNTAAEYDGVEIIIRPRPATTLEAFRAELQKSVSGISDRLHLIKDESVREWILASDVVVSSHSTSLIEASVAGKRALMLEPNPIPSALSVMWQEYVPRIRKQSEFLHICLDEPGG